MEMTVRLLVPEKKGISKRISQAVSMAGGSVEQARLQRKMRGMRETEIVVSFAQESLWPAVLQSLGEIPGIAILSLRNERDQQPDPQ